MHPFPPASELQFLIGKEIGEICLDPWSVQFRFADDGQMTIEGQFEHVDAKGQSHHHHTGTERDRAPVYMRDLILERITELQSEPLCLTLNFSNGAALRIATDVGAYENGQIGTKAGLIIF